MFVGIPDPLIKPQWGEALSRMNNRQAGRSDDGGRLRGMGRSIRPEGQQRKPMQEKVICPHAGSRGERVL